MVGELSRAGESVRRETDGAVGVLNLGADRMRSGVDALVSALVAAAG